VRRGAVVVVAVLQVVEVLRVDVGALREPAAQLLQPRVEPGDVGVHLDAVAGREHDRLEDVLQPRERLERLGSSSAGTASRSSNARSALRWLHPTTRRDMGPFGSRS
jgi:hypothetical protein